MKWTRVHAVIFISWKKINHHLPFPSHLHPFHQPPSSAAALSPPSPSACSETTVPSPCVLRTALLLCEHHSFCCEHHPPSPAINLLRLKVCTFGFNLGFRVSIISFLFSILGVRVLIFIIWFQFGDFYYIGEFYSSCFLAAIRRRQGVAIFFNGLR